MKVAVVGGGVSGLSVAYHLAREGAEVVLLERGMIGYGASTRAGGGFRVHFWAEENVRFAVESRKRLLNLGRELGWNPVIERGGYLWLLEKEDDVKRFRNANNMWRKHGVGGRFLSPEELRDMFPYLRIDDVLEGFLGPQDGKFHHDFIIYGYYKSALDLGVSIHEGTEVFSIITDEERVIGVETSRGGLDADAVVVAAAEETNSLLEPLGINLPVKPVRREAAVTEPTQYFIEPLIIDWETNAYFTQTLRGEIIGGIDYPVRHGKIGLGTTLGAVSAWARALIRRIPTLRDMRVVRTWSGYYTMSIDSSHIMGRDDEWPEGLYVACGYSGHGFMMAPLVGELLSRNILYGEVHELMRPFLPSRFREGRMIPEALVIGGEAGL